MGEGRRWIKAKATFGRHRRRRRRRRETKVSNIRNFFPHPSFLLRSFFSFSPFLPCPPANPNPLRSAHSVTQVKSMTAEGEATHLRSWRIHSFAAKQTSVVLWSRLTKTCRFLSPSYPIGPMRIDPTDEQVVLPPPPENERERLISSRLTVNHTGKLRAARPLARFLPSLSFPNWRAMFLPTLTQRALLLYVRPSLHWHCWRHQLRSARSS